MMQIFRKDFAYSESDNVQMLAMSFRFVSSGPNLKMFFILPTERYGLNDFLMGIENLNSLTALFRNANSTYLTKVAIPKFIFEYELDLAGIMPLAGITDIFDASKADLSAITRNKGLSVGAAVHKAFIELTEDGVEAAAATAMSIELTYMNIPDDTGPVIEFIADHPFLFAIVDTRSYTTLFIGKYIN